MAMARLLVVILKVRRRYGRTYNYAVGKDDGPHVDEINGHRVEVGVGVLPNEKVEVVILDCDLGIVINNDGDVDGGDVVYREVQQMELMMKAVVTE